MDFLHKHLFVMLTKKFVQCFFSIDSRRNFIAHSRRPFITNQESYLLSCWLPVKWSHHFATQHLCSEWRKYGRSSYVNLLPILRKTNPRIVFDLRCSPFAWSPMFHHNRTFKYPPFSKLLLYEIDVWCKAPIGYYSMFEE